MTTGLDNTLWLQEGQAHELRERGRFQFTAPCRALYMDDWNFMGFSREGLAAFCAPGQKEKQYRSPPFELDQMITCHGHGHGLRVQVEGISCVAPTNRKPGWEYTLRRVE